MSRVVLVCGGRDYLDAETVHRVLSRAHSESPITCIVHGGASGADSLAADWARRHGIPWAGFHADWKTHGKAAGPIRNKRMLDEKRPDLVVAFPGGRGTSDMIRQALAAGVKVCGPGYTPAPLTSENPSVDGSFRGERKP